MAAALRSLNSNGWVCLSKIVVIKLFTPFFWGAFLFSHSAAASSSRLFIDARYDFASLKFNDSANEALVAAKKEDGYQTFSFGTLRFDYRKQLNEELFIRVRPRLDRSYGTNNSDNISSAIELAYIEHRLSESLTLSLGKVFSEIGGFEGNTSSADLYHTSEIFSGRNVIGENLLSDVSAIGVSSYRYPTGAKLDYKFGEFTLGVLAGNRPTRTTEKDSPHFFKGLVFKGKVSENHQLRASYHDETDDRGGWENKFYALGWMGQFGSHEVMLDYLRTDLVRDNFRYLEGVSLQWAAAWSSYWRSVLKYTRYGQDAQEFPIAMGNSSQEIGNGYSAVAEYRPFESSSFRYHFGGRLQDFTGSASGRNLWQATEYIVGFRLNWDFLKD